MPRETTISPSPAGAGRFSDFFWPDPLLTTLSASSVATMRNRLNNTTVAVVSGNFGTGGAGSLAPANPVALGTGVVQLFGGAADGAGQLVRITPAPLVYGRLVKNFVPTTNDEYGVTRIYANIAWSAAIGAGTVDSGLQVVTGATPLVVTPTQGFGINRSSAGRITLITVDSGNVLRSTNLTGPGTTLTGFDETKLHSYELQIVSATQSAEASLRVLIDGNPVATRSWGAGSVLPLAPVAQLGFLVQMFNISGTSIMNVQQLRIIQAPTLQDAY